MVAFNTLASRSTLLNIRLYVHGEAVWLSMHYSRVFNLWRFNKTRCLPHIFHVTVTVADYYQQFPFSHYSISGILTLASKIHPFLMKG